MSLTERLAAEFARTNARIAALEAEATDHAQALVAVRMATSAEYRERIADLEAQVALLSDHECPYCHGEKHRGVVQTLPGGGSIVLSCYCNGTGKMAGIAAQIQNLEATVAAIKAQRGTHDPT